MRFPTRVSRPQRMGCLRRIVNHLRWNNFETQVSEEAKPNLVQVNKGEGLGIIRANSQAHFLINFPKESPNVNKCVQPHGWLGHSSCGIIRRRTWSHEPWIPVKAGLESHIMAFREKWIMEISREQIFWCNDLTTLGCWQINSRAFLYIVHSARAIESLKLCTVYSVILSKLLKVHRPMFNDSSILYAF